ncbi:hypothetical protein [Haloarcula onubensis]|uniref:Uncharacterized protein n=1 Tax=Haloarcula onubensis TaxID=2950539 RepID=A0ABU2FMS9_9EURY|nr:hypothetical protein [Halomicroarcula sp. S3CR25-11]MDS0282065.1 hypothetical protein [Halomicroarcula sp. S3CR25-11]
MNRRTLLGTVATTGIVALTGCLSDGSGGGTPSDTATATDTPTPTPTPTFTDSDFEVLSTRGGTQVDSATVTVDGTDIVVEGTVWGRDGCRTAELASVNYNADELTVAVATTRRADAGEACTQGVVEIDYRATVEFDDAAPGTVVVTHDRGDGAETVVNTSP